MPEFNETIRVFGEELDETDAFIDATVVGYSLDGDVKLEEDVDTAPRTWTVPAGNLDVWKKSNMMAARNGLSNPDHPIWGTVGELQTNSSDKALGGAQSDLKEMARELFAASIRGQRGASNGN